MQVYWKYAEMFSQWICPLVRPDLKSQTLMLNLVSALMLNPVSITLSSTKRHHCYHRTNFFSFAVLTFFPSFMSAALWYSYFCLISWNFLLLLQHICIMMLGTIILLWLEHCTIVIRNTAIGSSKKKIMINIRRELIPHKQKWC